MAQQQPPNTSNVGTFPEVGNSPPLPTEQVQLEAQRRKEAMPRNKQAAQNPQAGLAGGGGTVPAGDGAEVGRAEPMPQTVLSEEAKRQRETGRKSRAESGTTKPSRGGG